MTDENEAPEGTEAPKRRVRGPNKKKGKKRIRRTPDLLDPAGAPEAYVAVASVDGASGDDRALLRAQIADLEQRLESEKSARGVAEAAALAAAEAQGSLMQREITEVPTGRTKKIAKCTGYETAGFKDSGVPILKPIWGAEEVPTYFYKIDLPPCGGMDYKINGVPMYHGTTYEFDIHTLRTVKEIVYRCWAHDASIHGSDENAYRPKRNNVVSARA